MPTELTQRVAFEFTYKTSLDGNDAELTYTVRAQREPGDCWEITYADLSEVAITFRNACGEALFFGSMFSNGDNDTERDVCILELEALLRDDVSLANKFEDKASEVWKAGKL